MHLRRLLILHRQAGTSPEPKLRRHGLGFEQGPHLLAEDEQLRHVREHPFVDAWSVVTPTINPPQHMLWIMNRIAALGGILTRRKIASLDELKNKVSGRL